MEIAEGMLRPPLIQTGKEAGEAAKLKAVVEEKIPEFKSIRNLSKKAAVLIRDLGAITTEEEVAEAIK